MLIKKNSVILNSGFLHYIFCILSCCDVLFNISKYHLTWKLFKKPNFPLKKSRKDTMWLLEDLWRGIQFLENLEVLPKIVSEFLKKSRNFIIQCHWSPFKRSYFSIEYTFWWILGSVSVRYRSSYARFNYLATQLSIVTVVSFRLEKCATQRFPSLHPER